MFGLNVKPPIKQIAQRILQEQPKIGWNGYNYTPKFKASIGKANTAIFIEVRKDAIIFGGELSGHVKVVTYGVGYKGKEQENIMELSIDEMKLLFKTMKKLHTKQQKLQEATDKALSKEDNLVARKRAIEILK